MHPKHKNKSEMMNDKKKIENWPMFYWHYQHISKITWCINNFKFYFSLRSATIKNNNLTFVCSIFSNKKKENICSTSTKLHLNFHSINLCTNFVHPKLTFFSFEPTTKPSPFWYFHFGHPWQHHFVFFPST
jgi:hypothetical protein